MTDTPSYEEARDELIAVVQKIETGGTTLQESIELWERGEELAQICQRWLDGARARLDSVVAARTGPVAGAPGSDERGGSAATVADEPEPPSNG